MDWIRLTKDTSKDLNGLAGASLRKDIPLSEVKQHCTADDAWTVIHNKVYNLTPYLSFHPGGVDYLLKVAGKDGTVLFNKYHRWVNIDFMLQRCMIGHIDSSSSSSSSEKEMTTTRGALDRRLSGGDGDEKQLPSSALPTIDKAHAQMVAQGVIEIISLGDGDDSMGE